MAGFKPPSLGASAPSGGSSTRDYGVGKSPSFSASTSPPNYLPGVGSSMGSMFGAMRDPVIKGGPRKRLFAQDLGTVVGRRGAGISQLSGDEGLHSVGQYGKTNPIPHLEGGGGGDTGTGEAW